MIRRIWQMLFEATRRYFVAGLVALSPIVVTLAAIAWIIRTLDNLLLPRVIQWFVPNLETPLEAPPLVGAVFTFAVILLAGVIVRAAQDIAVIKPPAPFWCRRYGRSAVAHQLPERLPDIAILQGQPRPFG